MEVLTGLRNVYLSVRSAISPENRTRLWVETRPYRGLAYTAGLLYALANWGPPTVQWAQDAAQNKRAFYYLYDLQNTTGTEITDEPGRIREDPVKKGSFRDFLPDFAKDLVPKEKELKDHAGVDSVPKSDKDTKEGDNIIRDITARTIYAIVPGVVTHGGVRYDPVSGSILEYVGLLERDLCYSGGYIPKGVTVRGTDVLDINTVNIVYQEGSKAVASAPLYYSAGCIPKGTHVSVLNFHLDRYLVHEGDTVLPQQNGGLPIGILGETGERVNGPHSHTQVHVIGEDETRYSVERREESNITIIPEVYRAFTKSGITTLLSQPSALVQRFQVVMRNTCDAVVQGPLEAIAQDGEEVIAKVKPLYGGCPWNGNQTVTLVGSTLPGMGDVAQTGVQRQYVFTLHADKEPDQKGRIRAHDIGYQELKRK